MTWLTPVNTYWWEDQALASSNFGDALTPLLLEHYADASVSWTAPVNADVVVTGSVLHHLPPDWRGTVLGAGTLCPDSKVPLLADYRAVRGPLTASLLPAGSDAILGDPGLLAGQMTGYRERIWELGIVPHWSDRDLAHRFKGYVIDVTKPPLEVIAQIASCKRIVSSSLHGLIVADSFGIPRRAELTPGVLKDGGTWKLRDYSLSVGIPFTVGEFQAPVYSVVEDRINEILDVLGSYRDEVRSNARGAVPTWQA